jgi:subtilase family serine protease
MQRDLFLLGPIAAVVVVLVVLPASAAAVAVADMGATTTLAGSVAVVTANKPGVGAVAQTVSKTIEVWMAGDQRAAERYARAVSTPGSPSFRRFVSPSAYTETFGPSASQVQAVQSYLTGAGFSAVSASINDDYVSATAKVSAIKHFTVPASISRDVLAVTGLNGSRPQAATAATAPSRRASAKAAACSRYWAQKTQTFTPAFRGLTKAVVPPCGYSAKQLRGAYGLTSANTGKGETIALIQIGGPDKMFQTLTDYAKVNGLRAPRRAQYHEEAIGQGHRNPKCVNVGSTEAPLDSESAYAMAPGANQLMVDGDDCNTGGGNYAQSLFDAELAPLTGKGSEASASIESVSYVFSHSERDTVASQLKIVHAIALRAAAEGVSLLTSSGDHAGVSSASDPDITIVGGTTLGISAHDQRVFETGWSTAVGERAGHSGPWKDDSIIGAGGGGVSAVFDEPGYQKGVVPNSMALNRAGDPGRTVPDISSDGDPNTGARFGYIATHPDGRTTPFTPFTNAGTSMATPVVAGIVADAEQGQPASFGFLNPLLYSRAGTRAFRDVLPAGPSDPQVDRAFYQSGLVEINHKLGHGFLVSVNDAQARHGSHQVTAPGYDTMTRLGSPNGSAFINALRSAPS